MSATIERVGGLRADGSGMAEVAARAGLDVVVLGKLDPTDEKEALRNIRFTSYFVELADRQVVIEAVVEDESAKGAVFAALDVVVEDRSPCSPPTRHRSR